MSTGTLCRFFAQGKCKRGAACAFRHDTPAPDAESSVSKPVHVWNPAAKPFVLSQSAGPVPPRATADTLVRAVDAPVLDRSAALQSDDAPPVQPTVSVDNSASRPVASDTPLHRPAAASRASACSPVSPTPPLAPDLSHVVVATGFPRTWTVEHLRTHALQRTAATIIQEIRIMPVSAAAPASTVDLADAFQRGMRLDETTSTADTCAFIVFETGASARACLSGQSLSAAAESDIVRLSPCTLAGRANWPPFPPPPDLLPQRRSGQYVVSSLAHFSTQCC